MAQIVSIDEVAYSSDATSPTFIHRVKSVLERQGQIEPLQVRALATPIDGVKYTTFDCDAWGNEILVSARALGWKTVLIVVMKKYEH